MTRPSLRQAIDAMCKGCIYDKLSPGTWREQVECCSSSNCPLFDVRPVSVAATKERAAERAEIEPDPKTPQASMFFDRDGPTTEQ